jgi:archaellum component FlaD/FlaE
MHSPPDDSPTESDRSQRPNEDTAETDAWPPEADDDSSTIETGGAPEVSSTISEVTSKVSEEMGQIVDGEEAPNSLAEPAATVVGTEQRSDDPLTDDVDEEQTAADADDLSVEDIDQLLESDDWAVEIDDIEIDEDAPLEGVLEEEEDFLDEETDVIDEHNGGDEDAPLGEGQDTVETDAGALDELDLENDEVEEEGTEDEPAGQSTDGHAADPARLAESAAPAEAMRTYVEEGNPEATSVEPESTAGAFEFGKVLMPNDDEPDLPELVGADVEKPYLEALPKGYATDSLAIEWMGWLVNEGDAASAVDLVLYYEEAGWLGERATDDLLAYLEGLVDLGDAPSNGSLETYDLETHLHGLEYIKEISEDPTLSEVTTDGV